MKKILALAVLLLPVLTLAAPTAYESVENGVKGTCASGTCDAPSEAAGSTDGLLLSGSPSTFFYDVKSVTVIVCADSGQTLSGAGTLTAYTRSPVTALWAAVPDLNLTVASSARRCQSFQAFEVPTPVGRATWVPTGVTVSSGGVTVYIIGK